MAQRWKNRPEGANWGEFGADDQCGRLNLLTPEKVKQGVAEVKEGRVFALSLPLDYPGENRLHPARTPPLLQPVYRDGKVYFMFPLANFHASLTDVVNDDAMALCSQYSTQWDSLAHVGSMFDADGDGTPEPVFYNGYKAVDPSTGKPTRGEVGVHDLGIENMARKGVQGRGVLVDLHPAFGAEHRRVGYDDLMRVMEAQGAEIEQGDILCLHTGFAQALLDMRRDPDPKVLHGAYAGLEGSDQRLLQWITDSGVAVIVSDNFAVEAPMLDPAKGRPTRGPALPLHEHCLFKLGVHLGELWYLTELAAWLHENGRNRFLLTAQPLHMPGAVGSPATPLATV